MFGRTSFWFVTDSHLCSWNSKLRSLWNGRWRVTSCTDAKSDYFDGFVSLLGLTDKRRNPAMETWACCLILQINTTADISMAQRMLRRLIIQITTIQICRNHCKDTADPELPVLNGCSPKFSSLCHKVPWSRFSKYASLHALDISCSNRPGSNQPDSTTSSSTYIRLNIARSFKHPWWIQHFNFQILQEVGPRWTCVHIHQVFKTSRLAGCTSLQG